MFLFLYLFCQNTGFLYSVRINNTFGKQTTPNYGAYFNIYSPQPQDSWGCGE